LWTRTVQYVIYMGLNDCLWICPPALHLGIRQLNHAALGIQPPAFQVVFNERNYGVAREAVLFRHSLHLILPQSDQPVIRGSEDRTVCVGNDLMANRIAFGI